MKFLRFLCNVLLFFATCVLTSLVQVGTFDLLALQSPSVDPIHIVAQKEEDVAYVDTYTFWADDISTGWSVGPKYRIRSWFNWDWWKTGMEWADVALDTVIATVKPIFVPVAQINAVRNYHGFDVNSSHISKEILRRYETTEAANNALYETYVLFGNGYGNDVMTFDDPTTPDINEAVLVSTYVYPESGYYYEKMSEIDFTSKAEYARWVDRNKDMYNQMWKLNKYNQPCYAKYYSKFIVSSGEDVDSRHIKPAAIVLYYQQYVAIIIALFFVIKYPINFITYKYEGKGKVKDKKTK